MSRRITRWINGLKFRTSKTRFRMPTKIIALAVVLFTSFIAGGGLYDIFDKPPTILGGSRGYIAVRGMNDEQTLLESVMAMFLSILIFAGLLVSYKSTEVIYNTKRATMRLVFGILLLLVGLTGCFYLLNLKYFVLRNYGI